MNFSIDINLDNAAFEGEECGEQIVRILDYVHRAVRYQSRSDIEKLHRLKLYDANGNVVGRVNVKEQA